MIRPAFLILAFSAATIAITPARALPPQTSAPVSIVLPPRLLANAPATLAILGPDGHLAPGVYVDIGNGQHVTTDATGRASFTAPAYGAFIATAQGASAAALVDLPAPASAAAPKLSVAPDVSQHDRFAICGGTNIRGNVAEDTVALNGDPAFVLAASPVCVIVLPQSRTMAGPTKIVIESADAHSSAATNLVALDFVPPNQPLLPGRKGKLFVRAVGTADALNIVVENASPDVIHFLRGETQHVRTSGGAQNEAPIQVQAIRSGDFSFHARILPPPDPVAAARYLEIAGSVAPESMRKQLKTITAQLERHPRDAAKIRAALEPIASAAGPGTLRTLIDAARSSL